MANTGANAKTQGVTWRSNWKLTGMQMSVTLPLTPMVSWQITVQRTGTRHEISLGPFAAPTMAAPGQRFPTKKSCNAPGAGMGLVAGKAYGIITRSFAHTLDHKAAMASGAGGPTTVPMICSSTAHTAAKQPNASGSTLCKDEPLQPTDVVGPTAWTSTL